LAAPGYADEIVDRTLQRVADNNPETRGQIIFAPRFRRQSRRDSRGLTNIDSKLRARDSLRPRSDLAGLQGSGNAVEFLLASGFFTTVERSRLLLLSATGWILQWVLLIA